jgi:hypothetical protein
MPAGLDVTEPDPERVTVSVYVSGAAWLKVAVTLRAVVIGTVHVPVPGQLMPLPLQPLNV